MQLLHGTTNTQPTVAETADAVLDVVPPVLWFIRRQMRSHRKDLSLPQFRVLCCINHEPCVSLSTVADFLGASLPTASRIVSGLAKKGLLERAGRETDRRQLSLQLTEAGRSLMQRARAGASEQMEKELQHLTPDQRQMVSETMFALRDIFGSAGFCLGAKRVV
jgi:DNA-binding MarR family transcriptional regulator